MPPISVRGCRFAPSLETLEAREVPAVQVLVTDNLLQIIGDSQANAITIHDNGQGKITVLTGNEQFTASGITDVKIDTGAGADMVNYKLTGPLEETESISAHLGQGADLASFNLLAGVSSTGRLTLNIHDGLGADWNGVKIGTIASGGSASVIINSGQGINTIDVQAPDTELGYLSVSVKS